MQAHCRNAEIIFDLFHVIAKSGGAVIDRVRVDEANRLRHDKSARKVIESARSSLLRSRGNGDKRADRVCLTELFKANRPSARRISNATSQCTSGPAGTKGGRAADSKGTSAPSVATSVRSSRSPVASRYTLTAILAHTH